MADVFYSNTSEAIVGVGFLACLLLGGGRWVRQQMSKRKPEYRIPRMVSDALLDHLVLPTTIMLALITAALVAITFLHQVILSTPGSALAPWETLRNIINERESALMIVYVGVAGILFACLAFAMRALSPQHLDNENLRPEQEDVGRFERARQAMARWAAMSAGVSAVVTVLFVPALLSLLMSVFQLPQEAPEDIAPPSKLDVELETSTNEDCSYFLPDGSEACSLMRSLIAGGPVPCDRLPIDARPLLLASNSNPSGYTTARRAPHLVCTWIEPGVYVAGETIPSGDLRAMNNSVLDPGPCRFDVFDEAGQQVMHGSDYEEANWGAYALVRLDPGDTIMTGGCGWVPARYAGLGTGPDGTIGVRQHMGVWSHPLIVGLDVDPGVVQVECEFLAWPNASPEESGSWVAALDSQYAQSHEPGQYVLTSGVVWPRC